MYAAEASCYKTMVLQSPPVVYRRHIMAPRDKYAHAHHCRRVPRSPG